MAKKKHKEEPFKITFPFDFTVQGKNGNMIKNKSTQTTNSLENYNDSKVSMGPDFVGLGYNTKGRNYSPAWGGSFQLGGNLPGAVGNMYARTGAPSNGKYAKKTKPSAQNGMEMSYYQNGLDFKPKSMQDGGDVLDHTSQKYENPVEYTREQFKKRQIPQEESYVLSYFKNNPKVTKVTSATTIDDAGYKWPNMVVNTDSYTGPVSKGLDPTGKLAIYDPQGQLPATERPIIKGKPTLINNFQKGGEVDSVSNEIMRRQLYRESRFKPEAINTTSKAKGLAQLRPIAVEELKTKHKLAVKPLDPDQAIKGHKKLMTTAYNKPWIDKEGTTEEVRTAKALAAYNWGPTSLINLLNAQKAKGVDINKTTEWIKALPKETQDYITDITGKNPNFEKEYQEAIKNFKYKGAYPIKKQQGGPIEDNRGQWAHPGKVTQIDSNQITMKGVDYPVLGVSDTGHQQMMMPNEEYKFEGNNVTEYPMTNQNKGQLKKLDQLTKFKKGGKLKKAQMGALAKYTNNQAQQALDPSLAALQGKSASSMNQALQGINPTMPNFMDKIGGVGGAIGIGSDLIQGVGMLKQDKQNRQAAHQFAALSDVVKQAATGPVDRPKRKYTRPEDMIFDPNEMSPSYGTGSNFLQLRKGGEVQNTYAPGTLYDDLGYEPLSESEMVKAQFGAQAGSVGSWAGSKLFGGTGEQSGAGQIGTTIGKTAGMFLGPLGSTVGGAIGGLIGGAIGAKGQKDTANWQKEGEANLSLAANQQNIHNQYSAFMENGGWMNPEYNPQVITKFGDHNLQQLLKPDPMMDTLRSGGHLTEYTPPTEESMRQYAMGGQLKTHWGGKAQPVSYNPHLPDGGESVEFKGQSHDDGGIGVTFGKNPVEVEGGEPAVKLQSGGNTNSLVVFGDMEIPSYGVSEIGDPKAKGKKFKNYVNDLNKIEARQNTVVQKGTKLVNNTNTNSSFDLIKMNSGKAMMIGGDMKLKDIAKKKQMASIVQNAILETADEHGLKSDELAKGKFKKAKNGGKFTSAQDGKTIFDKILNPNPFDHNLGLYKDPNPTIQQHSGLDWNTNKPIGALYADDQYKIEGEIPQFTLARKSIGKNFRKATKQESLDKVNMIMAPESTPYSPISMSDLPVDGTQVQLSPLEAQTASKQQTPGKTRSKSDLSWMDAVGAYLPYLRPSNQKNLDPNQLMGEMYALSQNQLDPVQSQRYNPLLKQATDYSFQDQLNANQADFNSIARQAGNNPAALAALAGQKYGANSNVLANQFRTNQQEKQGVYNENRATLNDANLKNLGIMDTQYQRQATAKSNTKAISQAALSSISDKIAKNKLENRTLGIYENLYNYRFGPQGRAWNMNGPAQFNTEGNFSNPEEDGITRVEDTSKWNGMNILTGRTKKVTKNARAKNGGIVKAFKG